MTSIRYKAIAILISLSVITAFMPVMTQDVYAAQKLGKPKITKIKASGKSVTLSWKKAKGAKKYQVYAASKKGWVFVKKIGAKKAGKYSGKKNYKLVKSGKKYKLYKKGWKFKKVKTLNKTSFTYKGRYSKTYVFEVRAINGKKKGKFSAAKKIKTKAAPKKEEAPANDNDDEDDEEDSDSGSGSQTTFAPGRVTGLKAAVNEDCVTLTWSENKDAEKYEIYAHSSSSSTWKSAATRTGKSNTTVKIRVGYDKTMYFKVRGVNGEGNGAFSSEITVKTVSSTAPINEGEYSSDGDIAWKQYLNKMFEYYKEELTKRGVSIDSTNKEDEFQKLQAIIQVMHDRVGISEKGADNYSKFPTGRCNWFYKDNYDVVNYGDNWTQEELAAAGTYYNGKDFLETIEFYGSCDTIAETECYLAEKAGLPAFYLVNKKNHIYAIIQANNIWYQSDAFYYMYPGMGGLDHTGCIDPSDFSEDIVNISLSMSKGVERESKKAFKLTNVFYGTGDVVNSSGGMRLEKYADGVFDAVLGITPEDATYSSSDRSVISFDNDAGTCTLHRTGTVYVTIVYNNYKIQYNDKTPTLTTTIKVMVKD